MTLYPPTGIVGRDRFIASATDGSVKVKSTAFDIALIDRFIASATDGSVCSVCLKRRTR